MQYDGLAFFVHARQMTEDAPIWKHADGLTS